MGKFVDIGSGLTYPLGDTGYNIRALTPIGAPDIWLSYLRGGSKAYRRFGIEEAMCTEEVMDGITTPLFFAITSPDELVVGGFRVHGPYAHASQSHALTEWGDAAGRQEIHGAIEFRIPDGVIEFKGAWVSHQTPGQLQLASALARAAVHALDLLGVRYGHATAADHTIGRWRSAGAVIDDRVPAAGYPDPRYQTRFLWFDRLICLDIASASQRLHFSWERSELAKQRQTLNTDIRKGNPMQDLEQEGNNMEEAPSFANGRVEIFDESNPADMKRVASLRSSGTRVVDTLSAQQDSLRSLLPRTTSIEEAESPQWVYYPWLSTLVRLLGPAGFRRVRLDRNRNKIASDEQNALSQLRVGVIGLSVGGAIAHAIALEGVAGRLRLADFDTLDLSNLNRLSASVLDLGLNKALLAQRRIAELDPYLPVDAWVDGVTGSTVDAFLDGLDVVVEECDSFDIKLVVRECARKRGIPVLMETSDRGLIDVERFDLEPDRPFFHGLAGGIDAETLALMSPLETVAFALRILDGEAFSARMIESLPEIGATLSTWPQLGGDVLLGGASVVTAIRRFGLGEALPSGRIRIDIAKHLDNLYDPSHQQPPLATYP